jgi:hypothetical protein
MATVHASCLPPLEDELLRRTSFGRVRAELLFWKVERHDGRLCLIGGLELMEMGRRKYVPKASNVNIEDKLCQGCARGV